MKKLFLNIILILFMSGSLSAQKFNDRKIQELTVPSPEVSSLGVYGDIDVDRFNGRANIQVPLHELNFEGLSIPISLSYTSGNGIKTNQDATWVGLGWSLSSEPSISRQINGICDLTLDPSKDLTGFPYTNIPLPIRGIEVSSTLINKIDEKIKRILDDNPLNGELGWDIEPDMFSVNIFGKSIQFILTQKALNNNKIGVKLVNPDSNYRVEYDEPNKNFIVTDNNGFQFLFSNKEYSVTAMGTGNQNTYYPGTNNQPIPGLDHKLITSWKLSKVIAPNKKELSFNYTPENYFIVDPPRKSDIYNNRLCITYDPRWDYYNGQREHIKSISETAHQIKYLSNIQSESFKILFEISQRDDLFKAGTYPSYTIFTYTLGDSPNFPQKLDKIKILDAQNNEIKKIDFTYTYFNDDKRNETNPKDFLRLKLDQIKVNDEIFNEFTYINPNGLPRKSSHSKDFWGYYNGKNNQTTLPSFDGRIYCPKDLPNTSSPSNKRVFINNNFGNGHLVSGLLGDLTPDFEYGKTGLINKIVYPTKGYTNFIYEPHEIQVDLELDKNFQLYNFDGSTFLEIQSNGENEPAYSGPFSIISDNPDINPISVNLLFGCGGFNGPIDNGFNTHRKCTVAENDKLKVSMQLINVDTNQVVKETNYTDPISCPEHTTAPQSMCEALHPKLINGSPDEWFNINFDLPSSIPNGQYKFMVKGLKYNSNMYDEDDGANYGDADYSKPYMYSVKLFAKIPKLTLEDSYSKNIGGNRISKVQNFDNNGQKISEINYEYNEVLNGKNISLGKLTAPLAFYGTKLKRVLLEGGGLVKPCLRYYNEATANKSFSLFSNNIVRNSDVSSMGNVVYTKVTEKRINVYDNSKNGSRKYSYNYFQNEFDPKIGNYVYSLPPATHFGTDQSSFGEFPSMQPSQAKEDLNGDLTQLAVKDNLGNDIQKTDYTYDYTWVLPSDHFNNTLLGGGKITTTDYIFINCDEALSNLGPDLKDYTVYTVQNTLSPLIKEETKETFGNQEITTTQNMSYNSSHQIKDVSTTNSLGETLRTEYYYPPDLTSSYEQSALMNKLVGRNQIASPVITKTIENGTTTLEERTHYAHFYENGNPQTGFILPQYVYAKRGEIGTNSLPADKKITYDFYDNKGNLTQYTLENGTPVSIIWGYNGQYPIAQVEGVTYAELQSILDPDNTSNKLINAIQSKSEADNDRCTGEQWNSSCTEAQLRFKLNQLRFHTFFNTKPALITTYTYDPLVGVTSITPSNGQVEYYDYDLSGRLIYIKDNNGNILKKMDYHYKN